MSSASACVVALLFVLGASALEDAEKRDSRDSYLDAYVDSQGSAPDKESPPQGVVEAAASPGPSDTYDTLPVQSYQHQYPPTGYSTMEHIAPEYKAPVLPPNSFSATSYGVPIHPALPLDGTPSPSYGRPNSYGNSKPASTYSKPAPTYSQPAPTYSQPAPTYSQPAPTYSQPAPTYSQPAPTYSQPAPSYTHPYPSYSTPAPAYGAPAPCGTPGPKYGPPDSYCPPAPTYGPPTKTPHPMTSYGPPDRGMGGIPFHTILQILLKVLIFKAIVKFIAIICVLLFLPKFDLGHGHNKDDEMRQASLDHVTKEKLDSLTKLVSEGIGRKFDESKCNGDPFCRLAHVSKKVDREYTLMRLMTIFMDEYFDDDRRPEVSPPVPTFF